MKKRLLIALLIVSLLMMGACDPDKEGSDISDETEAATVVSAHDTQSTKESSTVVTTEQEPGSTAKGTTDGNVRLPKDEF